MIYIYTRERCKVKKEVKRLFFKKNKKRTHFTPGLVILCERRIRINLLLSAYIYNIYYINYYITHVECIFYVTFYTNTLE